MCHRVLFHLEWRVTAYSSQIVTGGCLIFFFLFSLITCYVHHCPLCFLLFNFSPHFIKFFFGSFFIYRSFYSFQFSLSIAISYMFDFSFWSSIFKISNVVFSNFVQFFFLQFHPSIKISIVLFFSFLILFIFFLLLKPFFNSIKPSN